MAGVLALSQTCRGLAKLNLSRHLWDYLVGGTETETTLRRNRHALDSWGVRPRVLNDVSQVDCGVELLGRKLRLPIILAPSGSLESFHPGGGVSSSQAAAEFGVCHMLSSVSQPGLEEVANCADNTVRAARFSIAPNWRPTSP